MKIGDEVRVKKEKADKWLTAPGLGPKFVKKFSGTYKVLRVHNDTVAISELDNDIQYGLFYREDLELIKNKELL
jgi:hypothetical protein